MSAQHTEGPWSRGETASGNGYIFGSVAGYGEVEVAKVLKARRKEEAEANLQLLSCAPELLADLREAAATLRRYEALHRAKGTPESDAKADVNAALATRFEATIVRATGAAS